MSLTGGNRNDVTHLLPLIGAIPAIAGRPRRRPTVIYADRAYDHDKVAAGVVQAHRLYQMADYEGATPR